MKNILGPVANESFDIIVNTNPFEDIYLAGLTVLCLSASQKVSYRQDKQLYGNYDSNIFYDVLIDHPSVDNVSMYYKHLIEKVLEIEVSQPFNTEFYITKHDTIIGDANFKHFFLGLPVIALHPIGSINYRCLSDENIRSITQLLSDSGYASLIFNSKVTFNSPEGCEELQNLQLAQIAYLLGQVEGMICVDSGLKHLAAINSIPIIELSHIPMCLKHLNGSRIEGDIKFSATEYWKPGRPEQKIVTLYPRGNFQEADIISGCVLNSIDFDELRLNLSMFDSTGFNCSEKPQNRKLVYL